MSNSDIEQFAAAFGCSLPMAEATVTRIHQRVGREVPMPEILAAIKKIAPTRLTTDTLVARLQKGPTVKSTTSRAAEEDEPDPSEKSAPKSHGRKRSRSTPVSAQGQIGVILDRNWTKASEAGLRPPSLTTAQFIRNTQSAVGEPKPSVARVLQAVRRLDKQDVVITPNLAADAIIEADEE
jgi:hypothetical protein